MVKLNSRSTFFSFDMLVFFLNCDIALHLKNKTKRGKGAAADFLPSVRNSVLVSRSQLWISSVSENGEKQNKPEFSKRFFLSLGGGTNIEGLNTDGVRLCSSADGSQVSESSAQSGE